MRLLAFFRNGKLAPDWEYHVKGIIWRTLFSEDDRIVGEDRDQQTKSVTFFCLDAKSGKVLWEDVRLDEPWWVSIELISGGVVFINGFVKPDLPEPGKIYAVDGESGKPLWANSELKMLFVAGGRVYAQRELFDRRLYCALDLRTGDLVSEFGTDTEQIDLLREEGRSPSIRGLVFPEILTEHSHDYAFVRPILTRRCNEGKIKGPIEFIHFGKFILISFHELIDAQVKNGEGRLDNRFLIVDGDSQKVVFEETLNRKAAGAAPDSFFMKDDRVYFIREKKHLVAIRLRP